MTRAYSRRHMLATGASIGAVAALTACARPAILRYVLPPTLTLPPSPLRGWDAAIMQAWNASANRRFHLMISADAGSPPPDAQWVPEAPKGGSVASLMRAANLPAGVLTSAAVRAFTGPEGSLTAFPVALGQLQFYVNAPRLKAVGVQDVAQWTWEALERAVELAVPDGDGNAPMPIAGWGWGFPATWRALVNGLTGVTVSFPVSPQDGPAIVAATQRLVRLAGRADWPAFWPLSWVTNQSPPSYDTFADFGFHDPALPEWAPLFAFMPPWTMQVRDGYWAYNDRFPADCYTAGGCTLASRSFPLLAKADVVPTFAWGLAPSDRSPNGKLLGDFSQWLYGADQQRVLLPLGFPPLTADPKLQTEWASVQTAGSSLPRFDARRYFDPAIHFMPGGTAFAFSRGLGQVGVNGAAISDADVASVMGKMGISPG